MEKGTASSTIPVACRLFGSCRLAQRSTLSFVGQWYSLRFSNVLCYSAELCWLSARVDCFSVLSIAVYHLMWAVVQKMNPFKWWESCNFRISFVSAEISPISYFHDPLPSNKKAVFHKLKLVRCFTLILFFPLHNSFCCKIWRKLKWKPVSK